jgi:two-component system chemotaxis response regulator CheY
MKTLIVEDEFTNRIIMQEILKEFGPVHIAVNGTEAVEAVRGALKADAPYDLICLDIMMPEMDGQEALKQIRSLEQEHCPTGASTAKIIMTTGLDDAANIMKAFREQSDSYLVKPIDKGSVLAELRKLELIN